MPISLGQLLHRNVRGDLVSTGNKDLDALLNLENNTVLELCGPPGSGKSTLAVLLAIDAARAGRRVRWICGRMRPFPLQRILSHQEFHSILLKSIEILVVNNPDELYMAGQQDKECSAELIVVDHWDEIIPIMELGTSKDVALKAKIKARQYIAKQLCLWSETKLVVTTAGMKPFQGVLMPSPIPRGNWHRISLARNEKSLPFAFSSQAKPVCLQSLLMCQEPISHAKETADSETCSGENVGKTNSGTAAFTSSLTQNSKSSEIENNQSFEPATNSNLEIDQSHSPGLSHNDDHLSHSYNHNHNHSQNQHDDCAPKISVIHHPAGSKTPIEGGSASDADELLGPSAELATVVSPDHSVEVNGDADGHRHETLATIPGFRDSPTDIMPTPGITGYAECISVAGDAGARYSNPCPENGGWSTGPKKEVPILEAGMLPSPGSHAAGFVNEVPNSQQELLDESPL